MKKYGSLIALAVVIALGVALVVTKKEPQKTVKPPYSIEKVDGLTRIELTQPGESGGLVVLTHGAGVWALTKPVESPLAERLSDQIAGALDKKINSDPVKLDASKLEDFGLTDETATKIALFGKDAQAPSVEFFLGKSITIPETRAKRTFVKTTDGKVYRAQTDLGEILGKPVDQLRSKTIQKLDRNTVSELWVNYQDQSKSLHLKKNNQDWELAAPTVDFALERSATSGILNGVSNLTATGFADGKTRAEVGLDPWYAKIQARETGGNLTTVLLSEVKDGKAYAQVEGSKYIYEIAENTATQLATDLANLRTRLAKDIKLTDIARIDFGGAERIALQAADDGWAFARGGKGKVNQTAAVSKINAVAQLRAVRFETPDIASTGLKSPSEKVTITTKDGAKHTLLVGGEADAKGNLWGKWDDMDLIMVVPQWIKERSAPTAAELTEEAS